MEKGTYRGIGATPAKITEKDDDDDEEEEEEEEKETTVGKGLNMRTCPTTRRRHFQISP